MRKAGPCFPGAPLKRLVRYVILAHLRADLPEAILSGKAMMTLL